MEHEREQTRELHLTELALEAVWTTNELSELDRAHAQALLRHGLGAGGRFGVQSY